MGMQGWKQVSSLHLVAVKFNSIKRDLELSFRDGGTEVYHGVPPEVYEALMASEDKDKYHQEHILKKYLCFARPRAK